MRRFLYGVMFLFIFITALVFYIKSDDGDIDPEEFVGEWHGSYFNGEETVKIKKNGEFYQEFISNGKLIYKNSSKWEYIKNKSDNGFIPEGIKVSEFLFWDSTKNNNPSGNSVGYSRQNNMLFAYVRKDKALLIDEDRNYYLNKISK
jgi:hypothetical protein